MNDDPVTQNVLASTPVDPDVSNRTLHTPNEGLFDVGGDEVSFGTWARLEDAGSSKRWAVGSESAAELRNSLMQSSQHHKFLSTLESPSSTPSHNAPCKRQQGLG